MNFYFINTIFIFGVLLLCSVFTQATFTNTKLVVNISLLPLLLFILNLNYYLSL